MQGRQPTGLFAGGAGLSPAPRKGTRLTFLGQNGGDFLRGNAKRDRSRPSTSRREFSSLVNR